MARKLHRRRHFGQLFLGELAGRALDLLDRLGGPRLCRLAGLRLRLSRRGGGGVAETGGQQRFLRQRRDRESKRRATGDQQSLSWHWPGR
jgi:hypothetical protein